MNPRPYWPDTIFVTAESKNDPLGKRIISRLPQARVVEVNAQGDPLSEQGFSEAGISDAARFSLAKKKLFLRRHYGKWFEHCPGTREHICCNLWTVNPGEGCPYDCTYCFLQSYLRRNPTPKLFTNTWDMMGEVQEEVLRAPQRQFRVCTGEAIDSLVWDELTDQSLELVPFFARLPNATLELKTKSTAIGNLLALAAEHRGRTVVSWSLNAASVAASDEAFAPGVAQRLEAAQRVVEAGYRVAFHFDPVVYFAGWQDEYREVVGAIFRHVQPKHIAWISVSTLRYQREMQRTMIERFPGSKLPFGEQFLARDDKLRYAQPIRFKLLRFVWDELKAVSPSLPVYLCMESAAAWREISGGPPCAGAEISEVFAGNWQKGEKLSES